MRPALGVVLMVLLVTPGALAADAIHVDGGLAFEGSPVLGGNATYSSPRGVLDLTPAVLAGKPVTLGWKAAHLELTFNNYTRVDPTLETRDPDANPRWVRDLPAGTLNVSSCEERCDLLVEALQGVVGLEGQAHGGVSWLDAEDRSRYGGSPDSTTDAYTFVFPAGTLRADPSTLAPLTPRLGERVKVTFNRGEGDLKAGETQMRLDTRLRDEPWGPGGLATKRVSVFAVLTLEGAYLEWPRDAPAVLLAPSMDVDLVGTLEASAAWGDLASAGKTVHYDGQPVRLDGAIRLDDLRLDATPSGPLGLAPAGSPRLAARTQGDVDRAWLGGSLVLEDVAPAAVVGLGILALLLLGLALARNAILVPLYHRIGPADVLQNENRRRIFGVVKASTGATLAEVCRATSLVRVVAQHHLRMLEGHGFVVGRLVGRRRVYLASEDVALGPSLAMLGVLRDPSRRRVAELLRGSPAGLTQADLTRETGLSQRLVSYHLARLGEAGLVEVEAVQPRRYLPTQRLQRTGDPPGAAE